MKLKERIYNLIRSDDKNTTVSNVFDIVIVSIIIINIITVVAETFDIPSGVAKCFRYIEIVSVVIFTFEYLLRVWTSDLIYPELSPFRARIKYMLSFMALIDLIAILPFYVPFFIPIDLRVLRALRIVRMLRILKVSRYSTALSTISEVFRKKKSQLLSSIFICGLLMVIAAVLMYNIESEAQPEAFSNAFDALWWAVATLTTVGYGDIYPITAMGKILSAVIALLGIGLVAVPTGIISSGFTEQIERESDEDEWSYCPHCGKKLKQK